MRPDRLYLTDILEAADAIERFLQGIDEEKIFLVDEVHQSAVLQKLIVIGEAASRLSPELKTEHSHVPWPDIVGFRNIAVHAYFSVDWSIVWTTVTRDVPRLRALVQVALDSLDDRESSQT